MTNIKRTVSILPSDTGILFMYTENLNRLDLHNLNKQIFKEDPKPHHLYILSDEKIKEGDFVLYGNDWGIGVYHHNEINNIHEVIRNGEAFGFTSLDSMKKIIATTDNTLEFWREARVGIPPKKSLVKFPDEQLPKPSKSFIHKYMNAFNEGNPITEVMVEYEQDFEDQLEGGEFVLRKVGHKLKVAKDNTITIYKIKDSWTREEVVNIIFKFKRDCIKNHNAQVTNVAVTDWIKEYL